MCNDHASEADTEVRAHVREVTPLTQGLRTSPTTPGLSAYVHWRPGVRIRSVLRVRAPRHERGRFRSAFRLLRQFDGRTVSVGKAFGQRVTMMRKSMAPPCPAGPSPSSLRAIVPSITA